MACIEMSQEKSINLRRNPEIMQDKNDILCKSQIQTSRSVKDTLCDDINTYAHLETSTSRSTTSISSQSQKSQQNLLLAIKLSDNCQSQEHFRYYDNSYESEAESLYQEECEEENEGKVDIKQQPQTISQQELSQLNNSPSNDGTVEVPLTSEDPPPLRSMNASNSASRSSTKKLVILPLNGLDPIDEPQSSKITVQDLIEQDILINYMKGISNKQKLQMNFYDNLLAEYKNNNPNNPQQNDVNVPHDQNEGDDEDSGYDSEVSSKQSNQDNSNKNVGKHKKRKDSLKLKNKHQRRRFSQRQRNKREKEKQDIINQMINQQNVNSQGSLLGQGQFGLPLRQSEQQELEEYKEENNISQDSINDINNSEEQQQLAIQLSSEDRSFITPNNFEIYQIPKNEDKSKERDSILLSYCLKELPEKLKMLKLKEKNLRTSNSSYARLFLLDVLYERINKLLLCKKERQRLPIVIRLFESMQEVFTNGYIIGLINGEDEDCLRHFSVLVEMLKEREEIKRNQKKNEANGKDKQRQNQNDLGIQKNDEGQIKQSDSKGVDKKDVCDNNKKVEVQTGQDEFKMFIEESSEIFFEDGDNVSNYDKLVYKEENVMKGIVNQNKNSSVSDEDDDYEEHLSNKEEEDDSDKDYSQESGEIPKNKQPKKRYFASQKNSPSSSQSHVPAVDSAIPLKTKAIPLAALLTQDIDDNNSIKLVSSSRHQSFNQNTQIPTLHSVTDNRFFRDPRNYLLYQKLKPSFNKVDIENKQFYLARFRWQLYQILESLPKEEQYSLQICTTEQKNIQYQVDFQLRQAYQKLREYYPWMRSYYDCTEVKQIIKKLIEIKVNKQLGMKNEVKLILLAIRTLDYKPSLLFKVVFNEYRFYEFIEFHKKIIQTISKQSLFSLPIMEQYLK